MNGRDQLRLLQRQLEGGRQQQVPPPTRPCVIEELEANNPKFQELLLSSTHAFLDNESLLQAIQLNTTVQTVRVQGFFVDQLSSHHQKALWKALGNLPKLTEFHFQYFLDSSITLNILNFILSRAVRLVKLIIHDCKVSLLSDTGGNSLLALDQHLALKRIKIDQLFLPDNADRYGKLAALDPLIDMMASAPNLQNFSLNMSENTPHDQLFSKQALNLLLAQSNLQGLDLGTIIFDNSSMARLMHQLTIRPSEEESLLKGIGLKELVLQSENNLNLEACLAISQMLHHNTTLIWLDLLGNKIDEVGLVAIANSLKHNRNLKALILRHSNITASGQKALVDMLQDNHYLESIFLRTSRSDGDIAFRHRLSFFLQMNVTRIRRLLLNVNVDREQIFDKLVVHADKADYLFHLLRGNPSFLMP